MPIPSPDPLSPEAQAKWKRKADLYAHCASIDEAQRRRAEYFTSLDRIPKGQWPFPDLSKPVRKP